MKIKTMLLCAAAVIVTASAGWGQLSNPKIRTVPYRAFAVAPAITGTSATVSSLNYGKLTLINSTGACTITLPKNGAPAGSWMDFIITTQHNSSVTFAAATAGTLITFNTTQANSVSFGTGQRIGAYIRFISNGRFWIAINLSNNTMTVAP